MIYTFYSFKGGVGRSMALANIAELLYARGLKVLMVDFDLEAPGLERYFNVPRAVTRPREVLSRRGVIDMLLSYSELNSLLRFAPSQETAPRAPDGDFVFPHPVEPLKEFIAPIYEKNSLGGELSIIPAGRRDGNEFTAYAQRIRSFDWDDFYENRDGEAFFEWFRREAEAVADAVLIDSRTGVSELSGACTYLLADTVVMFVAPNQQNLDGTAMLADSLSNPELIEQRRRPLSLLFVPSRVEYGELKLFDEFARRFKEMFGDTLNAAGQVVEGASFDDLKLIYLPYFSYMEKVAVREPESAGASDMIKAYEKIAAALAQLEPEEGPLRKHFYPSTAARRAHIFLTYKRGTPDEPLARRLYEELSKDHEVFFDQLLTVGVDWANVIGEKLAQADFLIALISPASAHSEMFLVEVERAHRLSKSRGGRPVILPVRLNYAEPLAYPLSAYLDHIQFAYWRGPDDTPLLVEALLKAISAGELTGRAQLTDAERFYPHESSVPAPPLNSARPERLETSEGVVDSQSAFYVTRPTDSMALAAIGRAGVTITIKGPEQMGKSSLLIRTVEAAGRAGKRIAFIDFQIIDRRVLGDANLFFREFCRLVTTELNIEDQTEHYWSAPLSNSAHCTRYVSGYILKELNQPLVLAIDEVDALFDTDFRSDFFGMLRNWHNSRAVYKKWRQLDLVLVTSTEPYLLIDDMNQSPFNVGEVLGLQDFTAEQVADLNQRHGSPLQPSEVRLLMNLLGGHPYLVRRALYLLAGKMSTTEQLFTQAATDIGPFGDHLRRHLMRLHGREDLVAGLQEVVKRHTCSDERVFFRLHGAGLVRRGEGRTVWPRCTLYADYFGERLSV